MVGFNEEQFEDVNLAFDTDQLVDIVVYETVVLTTTTLRATRWGVRITRTPLPSAEIF